jgi:hypothetical protein
VALQHTTDTTSAASVARRTVDRFERLAQLEQRYTGPIPRHLLAPLLAQASPLEIELARGRAAVTLLKRHLDTHSHMTVADRALYKHRLVAWSDWLERLEPALSSGR